MISKTCRASQQCKKVIKQFFNDRNTNSQCYICLGAHQTFIFTEGGGKQLFYYRETITNSVTQSHFHCSNKSNMSFCNLACFECEAALTIITQTPRKSDALGNALSCSSLIMFTQQQSTVKSTLISAFTTQYVEKHPLFKHKNKPQHILYRWESDFTWRILQKQEPYCL